MATAIGLGVLLYPFESTVVPVWRFTLVDESGNPLPNTKVRQVWHHSLSGSLAEDVVSDGFGDVELPERAVRGSLLRRAISLVAIRASEGERNGAYSEIKIIGQSAMTDGLYIGEEEPQKHVRVTMLPLMPLAGAGRTGIYLTACTVAANYAAR